MRISLILLSSLFVILINAAIFPNEAKSAQEVDCRMDFTLKSWSFIYKKGDGSGTIKCNNGERYKVKIESHGGGFTVGKTKLRGTGHFSKVTNTSNLFGTYATAQAHGGLEEAGRAQVLTKGEVSLSLTATGKGFSAGVALGSFKISRR